MPSKKKHEGVYWYVRFNNGKYLGHRNLLVTSKHLAKLYVSKEHAKKFGDHRIDYLTKWYNNTELVSCTVIPMIWIDCEKFNKD